MGAYPESIIYTQQMKSKQFNTFFKKKKKNSQNDKNNIQTAIAGDTDNFELHRRRTRIKKL